MKNINYRLWITYGLYSLLTICFAGLFFATRSTGDLVMLILIQFIFINAGIFAFINRLDDYL